MDISFLKSAAVAIVAFGLVFVFLPTQAEVEPEIDIAVEDVSADSGQAGLPLVTAILANKGPATEVLFWVETDQSDRKYCQGSVRVDARSSKALSFRCPGLAGHAGAFTLQTRPSG